MVSFVLHFITRPMLKCETRFIARRATETDEVVIKVSFFLPDSGYSIGSKPSAK